MSRREGDVRQGRLHFQAAVFDLDGVITDTAKLHAQAWKRLIDGYLERLSRESGEKHDPFDARDEYRRYVDGKPRSQGLQSFLDARGIQVPRGNPGDPPDRDTVEGLAARKDRYFQEVLEREPVELLGDVVGLVRALRDADVKVAVASSSQNCRQVLEGAGIDHLFQVRVDGVTLVEEGLSGKPDPDMFLEAARRLGAEPGESAVFEDAVSGVEAAREGEFGLAVGVASDESVRLSLREVGAHLLVRPDELSSGSVPLLDAWFRRREDRRPAVLERGVWSGFTEAFRKKRPAIFLDYDGTLTPIVERPDGTTLDSKTREAIRKLAERFPVAVVSGRGREDVEGLVDVDGVSYAGSHGFDIAGRTTTGSPVVRQVAQELVPVIEEVARELEVELSKVEGALVEPKGPTVAIHFRQVARDRVAVVEEVVDRAMEGREGLRKSRGKEVFELRPDIEWDKGRAVLWLLEALELEGPEVLPLYVGDDTTDEDAFRALRGRGMGILVARKPRPTEAEYSLQDPIEVRQFLHRLTEL